MKQVRGAGICADVLGRQRSYAGAQESHKCSCACEPREWYVCAYTSELLLLPAEKEERDLSVFVLLKSCMQVLLKAMPHLWQSVRPAMSVIHAHLCYSLSLQTGKQQLHPSAQSETPRLDSSAQAGEVLGQSS